MKLKNSVKKRTGLTRSRLWKSFGISLLAAVMITTPSFAHKTFLAPAQHHWAVGDTVVIVMTSALEFPDIQFGPSRDRISFASIVVDRQSVDEISFEEHDISLEMRFAASVPGFGIIATSTLPRFGEIAPENSSGYLDEINASDTVRQAFEALPGTPALNRSYAKHSKSFICVDICEPGRSASYLGTGQALEFVAVESGVRTFQLLREGASLENQQVVIYSTNGQSVERMTDADGRVQIDDTMSGIVMLSAVWITLPEHADGIYHSDYATLTIDLGQW